MTASANRALAEVNDAYALLAGDAPLMSPSDGGAVDFRPSAGVSQEDHGVHLSREQIDQIVAAMNSSPSIWEQLSQQPVNRGLSLLIAVIHFIVWVGIGWLGLDSTVSPHDNAASLAPLGSLLFSGLLVPLIWYSDSKVLRFIWWTFFLFFQLGMLGPLLGDPLMRRSAFP